MANLNKVMLIGRLTRDPEARSFANGGKVTSFGFAVNNRRKNAQTGQWEDEPVFLDCDAFNRGDKGTLADRIEQYLRKGNQVYLEGHLKLDQWDDKQTGQKRSKIKIVIDNFEFLERREEGSGSGQRPAAVPRRTAESSDEYDPGPEPEMESHTPQRAPDADIPF
jgi:single-strand DNA-binding protein